MGKYKYKFGFKHDKAWAWHIGAFLCVTPEDGDWHREIYLFICIGKHDFSIGFMNLEDEEVEA